MSKITSVTGWLKSIDTGKKILIIQIDNAIPVSNVTRRPSREPETRTYAYKTELYEDTNLGTLTGEKVKCTLEDSVVINAESIRRRTL